MNKRTARCFCVRSLVALSSISLLGCFEEDYPNYSPEAAYQGGSRAFQLWTGNEDHPGNIWAVSWPNGHGVLTHGSGPLDIGDLDCWPISLFDPATWDVGDVEYFQVALLVQPGTTGLAYWRARESFGGPDAEWTTIGAPVQFSNMNQEQGVWQYWTVPVVDGRLLYSFDVFGSGEYYFGLVPIYKN